MIHLTRLNGNPLVVNSDLIKYAEASPDTMLTLINGEKIVVLESCEEVVSRTIAYRARVFGEATSNTPALALKPLRETILSSAGRARRNLRRARRVAHGRRQPGGHLPRAGRHSRRPASRRWACGTGSAADRRHDRLRGHAGRSHAPVSPRHRRIRRPATDSASFFIATTAGGRSCSSLSATPMRPAATASSRWIAIWTRSPIPFCARR